MRVYHAQPWCMCIEQLSACMMAFKTHLNKKNIFNVKNKKLLNNVYRMDASRINMMRTHDFHGIQCVHFYHSTWNTTPRWVFDNVGFPAIFKIIIGLCTKSQDFLSQL